MVCEESLVNVVNKEIQWLWKPFIPVGKVTLIQGDTGMGKTNLLIKVLADLSHGIYPPTLFRGELQAQEVRDPLLSFYVSIENGIDDTIAPLFDIMHGDRRYMRFQNERKGHFILCGEDIRTVAELVEAKVIVIDPWQQFLPEHFSTSNNHALRDMICDVQMAAEETGAAVILAGNYNKSIAAEIRRGLGGAELNNTLRSVLSIVPGEDPATRELHTIKMSFIGKETSPILIRQTDDYNLVYEQYAGETEKPSAMEAAEDFLRRALEVAPLDSREVMEQAGMQNISISTLNRAKKRLGVVSRRQSDKSCVWSIPGI